MKFFEKMGAVRPAGRLVAEKLPRGQSEASEVRVADSSAPHSSSSSVLPSGETSFTLEGRPPRGEEGALRAAGHVVEVLNASGGGWGALRQVPADARREQGFDVVAIAPGGEKLLLQVTRVEEQRIWKVLRALRVAKGIRTHDTHADMLWAAAEQKRTRADPKIVLVLDATGTPHMATKDVVRSFYARYAARARGLGFREVWLAGYTAKTTVRLDLRAEGPSASPGQHGPDGGAQHVDGYRHPPVALAPPAFSLRRVIHLSTVQPRTAPFPLERGAGRVGPLQQPRSLLPAT
jgi:hypothetical protein